MDLMSFDLPRDILIALDGGIRIHYGGANPPRDRGSTKLLAPIVILELSGACSSLVPSAICDST